MTRLQNIFWNVCLFAGTVASVLGCVRDPGNDPPPRPLPKTNSIVIGDKSYLIEQLRYNIYDIEYPDKTKEEGIAIRVLVNGAVITADIPLRLAGSKIDLISRDTSPDPGGVYYTFYVSVRGEEGMYCRIQSWDRASDIYGGWFSISEGDDPGEYVFEWELTERGYAKTISTGYIDDVFERIS